MNNDTIRLCDLQNNPRAEMRIIVGARNKTHPKETNDCTVLATAACLGVPYVDAHAMLSNPGRKPRKGFKFWQVVDGVIIDYTVPKQKTRVKMVYQYGN